MNPLTVLRDAFHFFSRHLPSIAPLCLPLIAAECLAPVTVYITQRYRQRKPLLRYF